MRVITWFLFFALIAIALAANDNNKKGQKGKAVAKPAAKPAAKQATKPAAKPVRKPANKPADKPLKAAPKKRSPKPKNAAKEADAKLMAAIAAKKLKHTFGASKENYKNMCKCQGQTCNCCFVMPITEFKACIKYTQLVEDHSLKLEWTMEGENILSQDLMISPQLQMCGILPSKLRNLGYCLMQEAEQQLDGSFKACTSIGFRGGQKALSGFHLRCLSVQPSGLSLGGKSAHLFTSWANPAFRKAYGPRRPVARKPNNNNNQKKK